MPSATRRHDALERAFDDESTFHSPIVDHVTFIQKVKLSLMIVLSLRVRRILAVLIDILIIMGICKAIGTAFWSYVITIGPKAYLIGYGACVLYHGVFNCCFMDGQTIGKFIMQLKVVTTNGQRINIITSLLRSTIIFYGFFGYDIALPELIHGSIDAFMTTMGLGTVYLIYRMPNRFLYDHLLGTMVVETDGKMSFPEKLLRKDFYRISVILVSAFVLGIVIKFVFGSTTPEELAYWSKIGAISQSAKQQQRSQPNVIEADVGVDNGEYIIRIQTTDPPTKWRRLMVNAAGILATDMLTPDDQLPIKVTIMRGYDMKIARSWESDEETHSPEEWLKEMKKIKERFKNPK